MRRGFFAYGTMSAKWFCLPQPLVHEVLAGALVTSRDCSHLYHYQEAVKRGTAAMWIDVRLIDYGKMRKQG